MLMLMPVSAGPAESLTCSRAIAVMAPDSHTPNYVMPSGRRLSPSPLGEE